MPKVKIQVTSDNRYRSYKDLSYNELKDLVKSLESDSKRAKKKSSITRTSSWCCY